MSDLTIAVIQSDLHWENIDANLAMFEEKIWSITEPIDVIVLPEMFNTGFSMSSKSMAEVPGLKTHKWLIQMAAQKQALIGGSYMIKEGQDYHNRFFAAFPDGTFQVYDKRHLFTLAKEDQHFKEGSERIIVQYKGWKICPLVCYDLRFPVWSKNNYDRRTKEYDYDLLIYIASWPKPRINAWDTLLQARAIENQSYTIGCNRVGQDGNGYEYVGHSGIYNYLGEGLAFIDNKEDIILHKLEKSPQDEFRSKYSFLADSDNFTLETN
ncbi:MAG: amidohydrolase [Reichenbachiella sp.]|uniref:amidohydrolase n=1 Tax=Reichenbachiella sp. TaxID=2184521 RepID=UPI00326507AF